jgi:short subunit dehydrogenase-like uncharacterized protein
MAHSRCIPILQPPLFQGTRLLINCAGPFTDLGERVISQAALGGVHYLDITNELGYVFRARGYNDLAQKTGAALVPACGFEVALADCAAHLVGSALIGANRSQKIDEINIVYMLNWKGASAGTRRSAIRSLATSWVTYRDGGWTGQIPGRKVRQFSIPGDKQPIKHFTLNFPSCESIAVPTHLPVQQVNAWMTTSRGVRFWGPVFVPLLSRLSRSILRGPILTIASLGGKASSASFPSGSPKDMEQRKGSSFAIFIVARSAKKERAALLSGADPYGLTAEIMAYAARQLTEPGYNQKGVLAPALAFDPSALIGYAQENWSLTFLETTA